jgi:hypothetical protein
MVVAGRRAGDENASGVVKLDEGRARVSQPTDSLERDVARGGDDDEATEAARGTVVARSAAIRADAVFDDEVAAGDVDTDAVSSRVVDDAV